MTTDEGAVLITGATGFVGMEVLARYLERGTRPVVALVRASSDTAARRRIADVLANLFGARAGRYAGRVAALRAELTAPRLGLSDRAYGSVSERVTTIVHSAASVSFTLPLAEAREINVSGTGRLLELAAAAPARGGLERFAHISTAYVAGTHEGRFCESDLDVGQSFRNSYEQSKFEGEQLVRAQPDLRTTILRPSIVVGDQRSGWTSAFNVLYWPLRAFARGLLRSVPALPSSPVDVVSVDYVADAIYELCEGPGGIGETYHLTAGAHASTIQEIADAASRYFGKPLPTVTAPGTAAGHDPGNAYFPYFSVRTVFDDAHTRARLEPAGLSVAPLGDYLERLLDFATRSRWGKRPIGRAEALAP
ncbi:MAG: SDR family oxidoreductase [Solirubrobacteraceae bacterium]